jgi:hypothetical protein
MRAYLKRMIFKFAADQDNISQMGGLDGYSPEICPSLTFEPPRMRVPLLGREEMMLLAC